MRKGLLTRFAVLLLTVTLGGCASTTHNIYGCCIGQTVKGNKNYVSVWNVWNEGDALPLAEEHCSKFGRSAKYTEHKGVTVIFDCVD